ncbi:high-affinity nicotinic acid transporter [Pholiota molesta]|nr:high-affinity nicotinic acid transporter [Pholiota molesta]
MEKVNVPAIDAHYDPTFVKKTLRMIDWRMLPILGLLYSVALIDRINLGVARTAGMEKDLNLAVGNRYSIASMIISSLTCFCSQIPGNLILRSIGPRTLLTICVVGWGIAQLGMAFVKTWGILCLCRIFLGAFESVFFPSLVFIITTWYKRYEVQQRLAVFYLSSIAISSFSSALAIFSLCYQLLAGKAGLNGWQWIFLVEGALTICLGVLAWFFVPDFPDKSRWLNQEQRKMILDRVEADRGDSIPDELTRAKVINHLKDPMLWALAISCYFFAWLSDKTKHRAGWMVVQNLINITGLAVAAYAVSNPIRYFGLFLVYGGATGCIPGVLHIANNITTHTKRAVHTASIILWGGVGGIMATTVFRQQDFPRYVNGMWATIGLQLLMIVMLGITTFVFSRRNHLRREGKIGPLEGQENFYYTI